MLVSCLAMVSEPIGVQLRHEFMSLSDMLLLQRYKAIHVRICLALRMP